MAQSIDDWVIVVALPVKPLAQLMIQLSVRPTTRATVYCAAVANVKSGAEQIASNFGKLTTCFAHEPPVAEVKPQ